MNTLHVKYSKPTLFTTVADELQHLMLSMQSVTTTLSIMEVDTRKSLFFFSALFLNTDISSQGGIHWLRN
jgi:hypothetical protein